MGSKENKRNRDTDVLMVVWISKPKDTDPDHRGLLYSWMPLLQRAHPQASLRFQCAYSPWFPSLSSLSISSIYCDSQHFFAFGIFEGQKAEIVSSLSHLLSSFKAWIHRKDNDTCPRGQREKMVRERRRGKLVNSLKESKEERVCRLERKTLGWICVRDKRESHP